VRARKAHDWPSFFVGSSGSGGVVGPGNEALRLKKRVDKLVQ
jgi:hypothetical protein